MGHVVSKDGVAPDPAKIERMRDMAPPTDVKRVHTFLGMAGYYRKFIKQFAEKAAPLAKLLHNSIEWRWNPRQQEAFDTLKRKLISAPVLAYPDFSKPFTLQPDACKHSIGAVLFQIGGDGQKHSVAYFSHMLKKDEIRYTATELEYLALVDSMRHFRPYLWGKQFVVVTDHRALQ